MSTSTTCRGRRHGMGILFFIAVGIIVVLGVLIGINQISSLSGSTRDSTATLELVHKATLLAESAVDEGSYAAVTFDLNTKDGPADGLFLKLRQFLPTQDPKPEPPVFEGATPFLRWAGESLQAKCAPELTLAAIKSDASVTLRRSDPGSNPVYYGPLDSAPITVTKDGKPVVIVPDSNESVGILGFANTACLKGSGFFKDIEQSVQFSRPYKCILMGPPWPFYSHTLFVIQFHDGKETIRPAQDWVDQMTPDLFSASGAQPTFWRTKKPGPMKSAFAEFFRRAHWFDGLVKKVNETLAGMSQPPIQVSTASIDVDLMSSIPVVFDADDSGNGKLEPLKSDDADVTSLNEQLRMDPNSTVTLCDNGFDLAWLSDASKRTAMIDLLKKLGETFKKVGAKVKVRSVKADEWKKYYNVPKDSGLLSAFNTLTPTAWLKRATRVFSGPADLSNETVLTQDKSAFELKGVYYFKGTGPYTLDKPFTGKGIMIFEDNVTVSGFVPQGAGDHHAVVVTVPQEGKADPTSITVLGEVTADLIAAYGTVKGSSMAFPSQTIHGAVFVKYLPDADASSTGGFFSSGSAVPLFPSIDRGAKAAYEYEPYKGGSGSYSRDHAQHMQVFVHPGYVKKLYWTKRDRQ